jgi:hypothetical protein
MIGCADLAACDGRRHEARRAAGASLKTSSLVTVISPRRTVRPDHSVSDGAIPATLIRGRNDDSDQVMVKALSVADPKEPRGPLVTVIGRLDPVGAVLETVIVAVIVVPDPLTTIDEKVTPEGPVSLVSELKPVPVTVKVVVSPCVTL